MIVLIFTSRNPANSVRTYIRLGEYQWFPPAFTDAVGNHLFLAIFKSFDFGYFPTPTRMGEEWFSVEFLKA